MTQGPPEQGGIWHMEQKTTVYCIACHIYDFSRALRFLLGRLVYIYVYVYLMQLLRLTFVTFTLEVVGFQSSVDLMDYRTLAVVKRQCQVI
jgi:hypothetical protein